ncbi:MAG: hypothetical protein IAC51_05395 [bacterium]|uniref:Uncharacterized protein n=1 Tax=Candidatus Aphodosoma intestinipullorum TaxID=2840674 RepID=A0A940IE99_9BACT|nr:hypothetical protein [Candidatus Aphodosoma intestinipullorum]
MAKVVHQHNCRRTRITGKGISFTGGERAEIAGGQGGSSERLRRSFEGAWERLRREYVFLTLIYNQEEGRGAKKRKGRREAAERLSCRDRAVAASRGQAGRLAIHGKKPLKAPSG